MHIIAERPLPGLTLASVEPRCPCGATFEDCRGYPSPRALCHARKVVRPLAGLFEDMEREDNDLGPMPDEDEAAFRQLVPVAQTMPDDSDDACPVCGNWICTCGKAAFARIVRPLVVEMADEPAGQCSVCQQWFPGWNGGVCNVCQSVQQKQK